MAEITNVSAVTLKVSDMNRSIAFYRDVLGLNVEYVEKLASFASFRIGSSYINLQRSDSVETAWGRIVLYCDNVDEFHARLKRSGHNPPKPKDASWGERFFHINDPDGHELSIAQPI